MVDIFREIRYPVAIPTKEEPRSMTFGEKIQQLRKERGWSQERLAEEIPISRQAVSKWESGAAAPDTENVVRLSDIFGVSTDYLLHDDFTGDGDISAVKRREEALQKARNRETGMMVVVGIMAMGLFWQLVGALIYQNHLIVLLGMTVHIVVIIAFEAMFRRYRDDPEARSQRLLFWQLTVWFVSLFPCSAVTRIFWALWPRPCLRILEYLSPFLLYLPLALVVTALLQRKKEARR